MEEEGRDGRRDKQEQGREGGTAPPPTAPPMSSISSKTRPAVISRSRVAQDTWLQEGTWDQPGDMVWNSQKDVTWDNNKQFEVSSLSLNPPYLEDHSSPPPEKIERTFSYLSADAGSQPLHHQIMSEVGEKGFGLEFEFGPSMDDMDGYEEFRFGRDMDVDMGLDVDIDVGSMNNHMMPDTQLFPSGSLRGLLS